MDTIRYCGIDITYTITEYKTPYMKAETANINSTASLKSDHPKSWKEMKNTPNFPKASQNRMGEKRTINYNYLIPC